MRYKTNYSHVEKTGEIQPVPYLTHYVPLLSHVGVIME